MDRLEYLLGSTPAPLRTTDQKARLLHAYVDLLLAYRPVAALLAGWGPGGAADDSPGRPATEGGSDWRPGDPAAGVPVGPQRARAASDALCALLAGPDADLAGRVRAAVALAGLAGVVAGCRGCPVDAVRSTAVASSIAALGQ
jgi:hypothetical protein